MACKHSALTINGLAPRGNPILGLSRFKENSTQLPYTTLIYGNGPGNQRPRMDPTIGPNSTDSPYYVQYAAIHQEEAFHDGSDVAIFASGPYAHLFQGVQEQSYIAHVMAYAMCVGDYTNQPHCRQTHSDPLAPSTDLYGNSIGRIDNNADSSARTTVINNPSFGRGPSSSHSDLAYERSSFGLGPFRSAAGPSKLSIPSLLFMVTVALTSTVGGFSSASPSWHRYQHLR